MWDVELPYHVVMEFGAKLHGMASEVVFLPGERVYLRKDGPDIVHFANAKGECECPKDTFRLATVKLRA